MKVGFYQYDVKFGKKSLNLSKVIGTLLQHNFDLIVLPELFTTGYLFSSKQEVLSYAEQVPNGETTTALIEISKKKQAYIIGGIPEIDGNKLYNTAVVVGPKGYIGKHRKIHLTKFEIPLYDKGCDFNVFNLNGIIIGVVICFDSWFPELCRILTLKGAQILCNPANFGGRKSLDIMKVRAMENMIYTVTANRIGTENGRKIAVKFLGESQIVSYNGEIMSCVGDKESIFIIDIDPEQALRKNNVMCKDLFQELNFYNTYDRKS